MEQTYRIGTRKSPLALRQVEEVTEALRLFFPKINYEIIGIDTYGDRDKVTPISDVEGTDFFTREIEEALLRGEIDTSTTLSVNGERPSTPLGTGVLEFIEGRSRTIDFAVHSAKDLPDEIPEGLYIAAITKSIDPYDCLISKNNLRIDELRLKAMIGVSSLRRKTQLKKYRSDFQIVDIRGNIEERLKILDFGYQPSTINYKLNLDAIVVAACALMRLGRESRIAQRIPFEILKTHPLQGALALEVRQDNQELIKLLKVLDGR